MSLEEQSGDVQCGSDGRGQDDNRRRRPWRHQAGARLAIVGGVCLFAAAMAVGFGEIGSQLNSIRGDWWSQGEAAGPSAGERAFGNMSHGRRLQQAVSGTLLENTYHIRGNLVIKNDNTIRKADTLQSCFMGFGFNKCEHVSLKSEYDADAAAATAKYGPYRNAPMLPPYPFHYRSAFPEGQPYCIECCANTRLFYEFRETWNWECDVSDGGDETLKLMEQQPLEFRFARRESIDDESIVKCDLPHETETTALTSYVS